MSGRLKLIEQQLLGIDSAAFQNLCDAYLYLREKPLASINRTGSQFGKQKTVQGTPDTFIRYADGRLRFIEYTTKTDDLVNKIKDDIDKCLDDSITGVPTNQIDKITIFFNSRLAPEKETAIFKYAETKVNRIELIGLDWLALEIFSKYLILAKDILGIPLDTGQLLPLQNFIEEYTNKGGKLSTPLDNTFLHRKSELSDIGQILSSNDLLIICGAPGVGKTKIALEAIGQFVSGNKDFEAFAVSKKDQDISEDLKIHLQQEGNYILLVDDANRQLLNFKQILGVFREKRKGNIKLIITVRDYALNEVLQECLDYQHQTKTLEKFNDQEITELISSDSFEIKNHKYQDRIVDIADGNARLAIMAARLANQEQVGFLYGDGERVFELYDSYFKTFIKDFDIFGSKVLLKTLGIISFFFTINRNDKEFLEKVLNLFDIDYYNFNEAIDELEKRELIEIRYNHARVSEQVMATYFFYKTFIKEEMLSFRILLFNFFPTWKSRFSDTIIPANNSFGYENVITKINTVLDEYLHSILQDEEEVLNFFSLFCFYKPEEMLEYFYNKIHKTAEVNNPIYTTKYELNDFTWEKDKTLDFLSKLFIYYSKNFIPVLELAFEYCRKNPDSLPELIKIIREKLLFNYQDESFGFVRQVELLNLLISKSKEKQLHYLQVFFTLSNTFLSHHFESTEGGRNHSYIIYNYPIPFCEIITEFRKSVWTTLFDYYETYSDEVLSVIKEFRAEFKDAIPEILEFDLSLLIPFIDDKLIPTLFENIYIVNSLIGRLNGENITDRSYQHLKLKFQSKEYDYYKKLDWDNWEDYKYEDHEDFERQKEEDIRRSLIMQSNDELAILNNAIQKAILVSKDGDLNIEHGLSISISENFYLNEELGFKFLQSVLSNYPTELYPLYDLLRIIVNKSSYWAIRLWDFIKEWKNDCKLSWQLSFFRVLPKEFVNEAYLNELLDTINYINKNCYLHFDSFEKFLLIRPSIIEEIVEIVLIKNEKENLFIKFSNDFFEEYSVILEKNFDLLRRVFLQQERKSNRSSDYQNNGLKSLLAINPNFLLEYLIEFYTDGEKSYRKNTHKRFEFVWDLSNYEVLIEKSVNLMIANNRYFGISEHPIVIFFHHLNENQLEKAKDFLLEFISKNYLEETKMNIVFDVIRNNLKDFFEEAFLHYLNLNSNVESFKKITWIGNKSSYVGDVIVGEIRANQWQNILSIVEKSDNQLPLISIRNFIKNRINSQLMYGEEERKREFINPNN